MITPLTDADVEASWQGFIARMHLRLGGSSAALAVLQGHCVNLLQAVREGDSCIRLDAAIPDSPLITRLTGPLSQALQSPPTTPLLLEAGHLYLARMWLAETRVSGALLALNRVRPLAEPAAITDCLAALQHQSEPASQQLQAIKVGLQRRLLLLTGGPGTGKTFTLARLMAAVSALAPDLRIALAAPTGKAASRLAQALASHSSTARWSVQTVHALVGMRAPGIAPRHGPDHPLPYDLVVIDEASMLGLELASSLLQALPDQARLILAGDGEQLASVDPGSVFADVLAAGADSGAGAGGLRGALVRLNENYRQKNAPGLARLARALQAGQIGDEELPGVHLMPTDSVSPKTLIEQAAARFGALLGVTADTPLTMLARLEQYRLLSAMRTGVWGSVQLTDGIDTLMRRQSGALAGQVWYQGRLIMLTRNLPSAGRVNGDIGLCCRRDEHWGVLFADAAGEQWLPVSQLQYVEPAWCLTVHKAQGSEYDEVDLVIAPEGHALARREVVYTGVTRARHQVRIWGTHRALQNAARQPVERLGTLLARLEAA